MDYIDSYRGRFGVEPVCAVLAEAGIQVAPWARKLWHAARRAGHDIGRDQVARLMKIAGISGVLRGKHRTSVIECGSRP